MEDTYLLTQTVDGQVRVMSNTVPASRRAAFTELVHMSIGFYAHDFPSAPPESLTPALLNMRTLERVPLAEDVKLAILDILREHADAVARAKAECEAKLEEAASTKARRIASLEQK